MPPRQVRGFIQCFHKQERQYPEKITVTMVTVVLLSVAILGATAAFSFTQMRGETVQINGNMADQAAEDSRIILENEALEKLTALASARRTR